MVITGHQIETSEGENRSEPVRSIMVAWIKAPAHPITLAFSLPLPAALHIKEEMNQELAKLKNNSLNFLQLVD